MAVDWGSFPDWLAGVAAVLALIFAAIAARAAWKANRIQVQQLEKLERADLRRTENEERSQAERVAVWVRMGEDSRPAVVCFNGSGLPVYGLRIRMETPGAAEREECSAFYPVKGPDSIPRVLGYASRRIVGAFAQALQEAGQEPNWARLYQNGHLGVSIDFRDVGGRTWTRSASGELVRNS